MKTTDIVKRPSSQRGIAKPLDPRKEKFLDLYFTPGTEYFANVYRSAKEAGYSDSYARLMKSPAINNLWIQQNNKQALTENHITSMIEHIAMSGMKEANQLRALELLAKLKGMVVEKHENKNLNIEAALADLK